MLKASNLSYSSNGTDIVKGISLDINEGDIISLLGSSGSGKSTLMTLIGCILKPTDGRITYKNENVFDLDIYEYRKKVRYIPAKPDFFSGTIECHFSKLFKYINVKKDEGCKKVFSLLPVFHLDESIMKKKTDDISTGEGKRLFLIQNLISEAEIYILDECFTGLDPAFVKAGFKFIKNNSKALLFTTHNIELARDMSTKSLFIKKGEVLEQTNDFYKNTKIEEIINYLTGKSE